MAALDVRPTGKQTLIAMLAVSVLAGGLGALFAPSLDQTEARTQTLATEEVASTGVFELPPIITNLGEPQDMWIRLEASIVFNPKTTPHPDALGLVIANDLIAYLRTVSVTQIQGASGLQSFRQILNERASIRSGGKVSELVLRTMVIQ
ncbi:MAG TPA: flagellar basal body-associated FliL family protein [Methylocella sp.]|nr:flagellar basal body-associated FliL family protein [Methylocella sp.]